jgi:hypothetical protein
MVIMYHQIFGHVILIQLVILSLQWRIPKQTNGPVPFCSFLTSKQTPGLNLLFRNFRNNVVQITKTPHDG